MTLADMIYKLMTDLMIARAELAAARRELIEIKAEMETLRPKPLKRDNAVEPYVAIRRNGDEGPWY